MANPEHVEIVRRGKDAINEFFETESRENARPPFLNLTGADFSGETLEGIHFQGGFLYANLQHTKFENAKFINCTFDKSAFDNSTSHKDHKWDDDEVINIDVVLKNAIFENCEFDNVSFSPELFRTVMFVNSTFRNGGFSRSDYSNVDFSNCKFNDFQFINCTLKNTIFDPHSLTGHTRFLSCNLAGVKFESGTSIVKIELKECDCSNTNFSNLDFSLACLDESYFKGSNLKAVNLSNATLQGASFEDCDLEGVDFYEADISAVNFKNAKNLHKAKNLEKSHIHIQRKNAGNVKYFDYCQRQFWEKWCDWERLRLFGRLPLFGASYTALVLIPLFFYFLAIYNDKIDIVKDWAELSIKTNPSDPLLLLLIDRLHPLPVPSLSLALLASTFCLAIASSIYALCCPSRIKEFSSDQWTDQLGHSLVHYWALSWKYRGIRIFCAIFYIVGGSGVLWVIGKKVLNAGIFILNNSQMSWFG